jgi:hypothetical protein
MPKLKPGESQKDYVRRCIPVRQHEHPEEDVKQSAAVCYSMYKQAHESGPIITRKIDSFLNEVSKKSVSEAKGGKSLCVDCDSRPAKKGSGYCVDCAKSRRNALSDFKKSPKNKTDESSKPQDKPCEVCGKPLGNEVFLGAVHGKCARKKHKEVVTGKK